MGRGRLGQSLGTQQPRFLARNLHSFLLAPPCQQVLRAKGPAEGGAHKKSRRRFVIGHGEKLRRPGVVLACAHPHPRLPPGRGKAWQVQGNGNGQVAL